VLGSDEWVTMGVPSDGSYGIPAGIVFGFPCECKNGNFKIIQGVEIDDYSRDKINKTLKELTDEADAVKDML
jgi:malate dehydrogenase